MEFLNSLYPDVKWLLVAAALALLAGLVSGTQRNERRYLAIFTVLMAIAGVRYHQHSVQDQAEHAQRTDAAVNRMKAGGARAPSR
jgi:hypothetical protein